MKAHGIMVRSGLSGKTVHVEVEAVTGEIDGHTTVQLSGYGDVLGHTQYDTWRRWTPVVYVGASEVLLPPAHTRFDAMRDIVAYLADIVDDRLDLAWRESMA